MIYDNPNDRGTAQSVYSRLESFRRPFLDRAEDCSAVTLPYMYPREQTTANNELPTPWQSIGARCVSHFSAKLMTVFLPPNTPFTRLRAKPKIQRELEPQDLEEIELALSNVEQEIMADIERRGDRVALHEAIKHLLVAGNVLLYDGEQQTKVFPLNQYVVRRDGEGKLLELVVCEALSKDDIPEEIRAECCRGSQGDEKVYHMYTHVRREGSRFKEYAEIKGINVPGAERDYPEELLPWNPMRWNRIDGEDYGRGHCELYLGDLRAAERLSRAIIRLAMVASRVVGLVNPNGQTNVEDLNNAEDGQYIPGIDEDVTFKTTEKTADMQVATSVLTEVERRLSSAFLLNSSIQRQAERVTAEEIRYMANELDVAVGGNYTLISHEYQKPKVKLTLQRMKRSKALANFPDDTVDILIITGIDALGRNAELMKLDLFVSDAITKFGPEAMKFISMASYFKQRAAALGLDPKGLVRSEEEVAEMNNAQANAELANTAAPAVVNQVGETYRQAVAPQGI